MARRTVLLVPVLATYILQSLYGCAPHQSTRPVNLPKLTVHENTILLGDQPYAELRFHGPANVTENREGASLSSTATQYRGLTIYYFDDGVLIWIYPKEKSWQEDVERCCRSQTQGYFGWAFDVRISDDGQLIYYTTPGLINRSSWVYSVADRSFKLVERK
jgi:hypothetical protein